MPALLCPQAVSNVNTVIGPAILGRDPTDQKGIDNFMVQELDGTKNEWGCVTGPMPGLSIAFLCISDCMHATVAILHTMVGASSACLYHWREEVDAGNVWIGEGNNSDNRVVLRLTHLLPICHPLVVLLPPPSPPCLLPAPVLVTRVHVWCPYFPACVCQCVREQGGRGGEE